MTKEESKKNERSVIMAIHLQEFDIHQFRGIHNLELKDLNHINIITGDNNTGKTSVLENINFLKGIDSVRNLAYSTTRSVRGMVRTGFSTFERVNYLFPVDEEVVSKIEYSFKLENKTHSVNIFKENYFELLPDSEVRKMMGYSNKVRECDEMIDTEFMHLKIDLDGKELLYEKYSEYDRFATNKKQETKLINTTLVSSFKHVYDDFYLSKVLNNVELYQEMLGVLKEFDEDIIGLNVDSKGNSALRKRYMILSKNHKEAIPLELYGDGMKKAILLMSAVIASKNGILLIDEFETSIHTSAMNKIFSWILSTAVKLNIQLFITSHSKEAIDKVLKCDPTLQDKMNLYTLYKKDDSTLTRKLSCYEAIEAMDDYDIEVR